MLVGNDSIEKISKMYKATEWSILTSKFSLIEQRIL